MSGSPPDWLQLHCGEAPLVVSIPHAGTEILPDVEATLVSRTLALRDTDWFVDRLYAFARDLGATVLATRLSRTVVDVNRDPSGASLYPGRSTTELCPTTTFDGAPLYRQGLAPSAEEIARRREAYFEPYHAALGREIERLRVGVGAVVVYDCHSIRSESPRLFDGQLPHFNIGTNGGRSCAPELKSAVEAVCLRGASAGISTVVDGRFKGGWITRHYGRPDAGVHAIQMELAMRGYMEEPQPGVIPTAFDAMRAGAMQDALRSILDECLKFARAEAGRRGS